jgi:tRNA 2-(methylsulfanyl)-N6-isopentenyladenosine37 hydroxylase
LKSGLILLHMADDLNLPESLRYVEAVIASERETPPLAWRTPPEWGAGVLAEPVSLLVDHAFLEKKAANNALELLTRWPGDWLPGWVETMTSVARDETAHLAQVTRMLVRRGGRLSRVHKNPYANALRLLVRKGDKAELLDRLFVSALIEARSCERFGILGEAAEEQELAAFYRALYASELGHYKVFLKLARKIAPAAEMDERWGEMLEAEARILTVQEPGPRIHSGWV